jgi:hypothetical protein
MKNTTKTPAAGSRFYNWVADNNTKAKVIIIGPMVAVWVLAFVGFVVTTVAHI